MKLASVELEQQVARFLNQGGHIKQEPDSKKKKTRFYAQYDQAELNQVLEFVRINAGPVTVAEIVGYLDMPKTKVRTILVDLQVKGLLVSVLSKKDKCNYWNIK